MITVVASLFAQGGQKRMVTLVNKIDVNLGKGHTFSRVFVLQGQEFLFSHNAITGKTEIWNLKQGGLPVYNKDWSSGWTNFDIYEFKGEVYLFHQKGLEGTARISKLNYDSIMNNQGLGEKVYDEKWSKGWTTTKFFVHNNLVYFFHYKKGSGLARLNAATTGGSVGTKIYEKNWSEGYTNFAMTANENNFFMIYQKGGEGTCVINQIDLKKLQTAAKSGLLTPNLGTETYRQKWSEGWSNICFFNLHNNVYMFFNKKDEGTARIEMLNPDGTLGERVYDSKWSSGWSEIDIYYQNGRPMLFHQKASTGQTKISEITM
jgi:hypothetical protein